MLVQYVSKSVPVLLTSRECVLLSLNSRSGTICLCTTAYRINTRFSSSSDPVQLEQPLKVDRAALRVSGASPHGAVMQRSVRGHVLIASFRIVFKIVDFASKISFFDDYAISYNCYMPLHNGTGKKIGT